MFRWTEQLKRESDRLIMLGKIALGWWPSDPQDPDEYWGVCPHCRQNDGYLNLERGHWFVCHRHRVRWYIGDNLFSTWRHETPADWKANLALIGEYAVVEWEDMGRPRPASGEGNAALPSARTTEGDK